MKPERPQGPGLGGLRSVIRKAMRLMEVLNWERVITASAFRNISLSDERTVSLRERLAVGRPSRKGGLFFPGTEPDYTSQLLEQEGGASGLGHSQWAVGRSGVCHFPAGT